MFYLNQPKGLYYLIFTQVWESFSYYGMRVLLVLYLTSQLHYQETNAFALYALYTTLVELGAFLGGYLADKLLGLQKSVILGSILICMGHLSLTFSEYPEIFFFGLGSIISGTTLFRGNLKAMVGLLYCENDRRCESGFTLYYAGINLGGFVAALLCGFLAQIYGWHVGFGAAAIGMLAGIFIFIRGLRHLGEIDITPPFKPNFVQIFLCSLTACISFAYLLSNFEISQNIFLPLAVLSFTILIVTLGKQMSSKQALGLFGMLVLLIVFFCFEELMGSFFMVFLENQVERTLGGFEIPSTVLSAINPFIIITIGPFLSYFLNRFPLNKLLSLSFAYLCLTLAFFTLYRSAFFESTSAFDIVISFSLIALGELLIAPTVFAFCTSIAPVHAKGMMMGLVTTAFALANLLSGKLSQLSIQNGMLISPDFFWGISCVAACLFSILITLFLLSTISFCEIFKCQSKNN